MAIDPQTAVPLFAQISRAVASDIRRGRLRPGDLLPGTRQLARTLGVNRNTVIAAYDELAAEGWTSTENGRGTFVSRSLPDPQPRPFAAAARRANITPSDPFELGPTVHIEPCHPCATSLSVAYNLTGGPDLRLVPTTALAHACRRAIEQQGRQVLSYGPAQGYLPLRAALSRMLSATRGLAVDESRILVTRGTQGALSVIAHALLKPHDVVVVEAPGYRRGWHVLSSVGAQLVPVAVDDQGLIVEHLETLTSRQQIRAVFVTPHHQYPTTVTLSAARRRRLLELARQHRFAIIEDDYDHEFHYEGRPILPLASADSTGSVIYVGSLSKTLAPGLRLGYVAAAPHVIAHLTAYRGLLETQGDQLMEAAVADLLEDGEVQRHVRRVTRIYRGRRDVLAVLLERELGRAVSIRIPVGGTAMWLEVAPDIDVVRWSEQAGAEGVLFETGERFTFTGERLQYVRIGFSSYREQELTQAVSVLAATLRASRSAGPTTQRAG